MLLMHPGQSQILANADDCLMQSITAEEAHTRQFLKISQVGLEV